MKPIAARQPHRVFRRLCRAILPMALTIAGCAAAAPAPDRPIRNALTRHETVIRGARIRYSATVTANPVPGPDGRPGADIVTIAYTRSGVANATRRPVIFAFNGGPGASSSPLHMKAMGPIMRVSADPSARDDSLLTTNAESPLDVADLVFIDPVSTGFSRAYPEVDPRYWYDGRRDALAIAQVIDRWLSANRRRASPRYLAGESYGTSRAALILRHVPRLRFEGVLLISGGTGGDATPDMRFAAAIPSMAAGAWYHERIGRAGRDVGQVFDEASRFARGDYAAALVQGSALPLDERRHIAERLSRLIGLPVPLIEANDLRINANTYMFNLLRDRGLRTGRLDLRMTSPLIANASGAIDDPALGVVRPRSTRSTPVTPQEIGALPSPVVGRYIAERLKFACNEPYYGVNFLANSRWTFEPVDPPRTLAAAMTADPRLRLFIAAGYFDYAAGDDGFVLAAGVPRDRLTFLHLPGPHEVYQGADNLRRFNNAVRAFVVPQA